MAEDYVDLTPKNIDPTPNQGSGKKTVFQETEWDQVKNNTGNLTKEGILEKIKIWKNSGNAHTLIKYQTMLAQCKNIAASGKTNNGSIIYSRYDDGSARWIEAEHDFKARKGLDEVKKKK